MKIFTVLTTLVLVFCAFQEITGQEFADLPLFDKQRAVVAQDWLGEPGAKKTALYRDEDGRLILSNGLASRTFTLAPNGATVGLDNLMNGESLLRSVRPEARLVIDGDTADIGGLTGQPIHNYLLPAWLEEMNSDSIAFQLQGF